MVKLKVVLLAGVWGLSALSCTGTGGSGTPGTGGSSPGTAGTSGAAGTGGTAAGTAGTSGAAGTTGAAGAAATAGTTGAAGSSAGTGGGSAGTGAGGSAGAAGNAGGGRGGAGASGSGGASGGAGAGGAAGDPCATALFCDDFEKYTTGQAPTSPWSRQVSSGSTAAVDTAQFHSGTKSVKFVAAAASGSKTAYIRLMSTSILPVMPNMFYGRMMFRLEAAPTGDVHWTFLEGYGTVPGSSPTYHALYRYGGQHPVMNGTTFVGSQMMANYETPDSYSGTGPSSDCWKHSNKIVIPEARWSCAEWQFDGTSNTMRFWLDGAAVDTLTVMGSGSGCGTATPVWTAPNFERMDLGWESYQQDTARTIWIDDVVLSKTRIGCPQ